MHHLDARAARRWGRDVLHQLGDQREEIDNLNVYPVPDGDTGTNLYLTVEAAVAAVERVPDDAGLGGVADAFARGALLGAKGNSGVILSQLLRGWADVLAEQPEGGPRAVRAALSRAAEQAYAAVSRPVEGTMLTVARAAAQGAERGSTLKDVVGNAVHAARAALAHTPDQLEALRQAGVVDAGGQGLLVLFESLAATVGGRRAGRRPRPRSTRPLSVPSTSRATPQQDAASRAAGRGICGPAYEVMYLLDAADDAVDPLRSRLDQLGDSLVVVGGGGLWNIHVHTDDVAAAVEAGLQAGRPHRLQVTRFADQRPHQPNSAAQSPLVGSPQRAVAVLAGAAGPGLARLFEGCGAEVVPSPADGLPSASDLLASIRRCKAEVVVLLPNDPQTLVVAQSAVSVAREEGIEAMVLPTHSAVQGLAAIAVHDPTSPLAQDLVRMSSAAAATRHVSVTCDVQEACEILTRMLAVGGDLLTVVTGTDPRSGQVAREVVAHVGRTQPQVEVSVVDGGQEGCLLLGLE